MKKPIEFTAMLQCIVLFFAMLHGLGLGPPVEQTARAQEPILCTVNVQPGFMCCAFIYIITCSRSCKPCSTAHSRRSLG